MRTKGLIFDFDGTLGDSLENVGYWRRKKHLVT